MEPSFLYHSFGISRSNQLSKHLVSMVATESKYQEAWCSDSLKQTESFFLVIWDYNYLKSKAQIYPTLEWVTTLGKVFTFTCCCIIYSKCIIISIGEILTPNI